MNPFQPHPERSKMPPDCDNGKAANEGGHAFVPLQILLHHAMGVPDGSGARVYLVCTRCWQFTYVTSQFLGHYYNEPPPLATGLQPPR